MQFNIDKTIIRENIQVAVNNYLTKGGNITVLPPQQSPHHSFIGGYNWGPYEDIDNLLYSSH